MLGNKTKRGISFILTISIIISLCCSNFTFADGLFDMQESANSKEVEVDTVDETRAERQAQTEESTGEIVPEGDADGKTEPGVEEKSESGAKSGAASHQKSGEDIQTISVRGAEQLGAYVVVAVNEREGAAEGNENKDPLKIDGHSFAIICDCVSSSNVAYRVAMSYDATTQSPYGFTPIRVTYDEETGIYDTEDEDTILPLWKFIANDNGTYCITDTTGHYLNINVNNDLRLSDTPQELELTQSNGQVIIKNSNGFMLDFFKNNNLVFSAWKNNTAQDNNKFSLVQPTKGTIAYQYPAYSWQETDQERDLGTTNNLPANIFCQWSEEQNQVMAPNRESYTSRNFYYAWKYTFLYWQGEDGQIYYPGDVIEENPEELLVLSAVWQFEEKTESEQTVFYELNAPNTGETIWGDAPAVVNDLSEEEVAYPDFYTYKIRDVKVPYYMTTSGKKYRFSGWMTEEGETILPHTEINLKDFDDNKDTSIYLTAIWTEAFFDPWEIDGKEYLLVTDNDIRAVSSVVHTAGRLKNITVSKLSGTDNVYQTTGNITLWQFDAQEDGTYYISTAVDGTRKYLNLSAATGYNSGGDLSLEDTPEKFKIFKDFATDKVYIKKGSDDPYGTYVDYFATSGQIFGGWSVKNNEAPNTNKRFTLGLPIGGTIIYQYPAYSGTYPDGEADEGVSNNLPDTITTQWTQEENQIAEPVQDYYVSVIPEHQWKYKFVRWKDVNSGTYYYPGTKIEKPGSALTLQAEWSYISKTERPRTVKYRISEVSGGGAPVDELPSLVGNLANNSEEVTGNWAQFYTVRGLTANLYKTTINNVYEFVGWQTENGDIIQPGATINLDQLTADGTDKIYDEDNDYVIQLTAVWNNQYNDNKTRQVRFFVSLKATSADIFNENAEISTAQRDFTAAMSYTLMNPQNIPSPDRGTKSWINLISYQPGASATDPQQLPYTTDSMVEANEQIRSLGTTGYVDEDGNISQGTVFSTLDFPTDEEMFQKLVLLHGDEDGYLSGITLDGQKIKTEDLNTENYTIRWYVCKYLADGWHIDGKLTPKLSLVTVTKTFAGAPTAMQNIPEDFYITLTDSNNEDIVYTLNLVDKSQKKTNYGFLSLTDEDENKRNYGYLYKTNNTYIWIIPVAKSEHFLLSEHNYEIVVDGTKYGIAAQYSITNTVDETKSVSLTKWFGDVPGYVSKNAADEINISYMQATNLYNTYVETGVFVIQKRDAGTRDAAMPGVEFQVFEEVNGGERQLTLSKKKGSADNDGQYNVLYDDGAISDVAVTGSDGNIYLTLPKPVYQGTRYTYRIVENVPPGYLEGEAPPSFKVSVNHVGEFFVDEENFVVEEGKSAMSVIEIGTPGKGDSDTTVTGVMVQNEPIRLVHVSVAKEWECHPEENVTVLLKGTAGGITYIQKEILLDDSNNWMFEENTLPLAIGNEPVIYTIEETKIGEFDAVLNALAFQNWIPQYLVPVYKDGNGNTLQNSGSYVVDADAYKVRQIDFTVRNDEQKTNVVTLKLNKISAFDNTPLDDAEFELYEEDPTASGMIRYQGQTVYVKNHGYVTSGANVDLKLVYNNTYYLKESRAATGYQPLAGWMKIRVDAYGNITLQSESGIQPYVSLDDDLDEPENPLIKTLTVRNVWMELVLTKVDDKNHNALEGAHFMLYKLTGGGQVQNPVAGKEDIVSDSDGRIDVGNLAPGRYYLVETMAAEGYEILTEPVLLTIGENDMEVTLDGGSLLKDGTPQVTKDEHDVVQKYTYEADIANSFSEEIPAPTGYDGRIFAFLWMMLLGLGGIGIYKIRT